MRPGRDFVQVKIRQHQSEQRREGKQRIHFGDGQKVQGLHPEDFRNEKHQKTGQEQPEPLRFNCFPAGRGFEGHGQKVDERQGDEAARHQDGFRRDLSAGAFLEKIGNRRDSRGQQSQTVAEDQGEFIREQHDHGPAGHEYDADQVRAVQGFARAAAEKQVAEQDLQEQNNGHMAR